MPGLCDPLENIMQNIMYEVPSLDNIDTCIITDEVISKNGKPIYNKKGKVMKGSKYFEPNLKQFIE